MTQRVLLRATQGPSWSNGGSSYAWRSQSPTRSFSAMARSRDARSRNSSGEYAGFLAGRVEAAARRGGRGGGSLDDRRSFGGAALPLGTESENALTLCLARLL